MSTPTITKVRTPPVITEPLRSRWREPAATPLGRASQLHFKPVEGTVLDLGSLDSLSWSDHDALWALQIAADGIPRGLILEGIQLVRRDRQHVLSAGRCVIPLQGSGRLVVAELRDPMPIRMDYGALVLRARGREVRWAGARSAAETVDLSAVILPFEEVLPEDLPVELNREEHGRVDAYRDLRRLDPPGRPRVQRHVDAYHAMSALVWAGGTEGEATTGQAVINLPMQSRVRATAALEAACATLLAAPSTSATRIRVHDTVKDVFATLEDYSEDRQASRRLLNELAELRCDHPQARGLAGVEP